MFCALTSLAPSPNISVDFCGQKWSDVIDPNITVISSAYDISNVELGPDGTINVVAVPVPEPSTWAMLAFGLLALNTMARRRAVARRR